MSFEIQDGKERLPDEEDIYGVNDLEEQERFNALLGSPQITQEERFRRRRMLIILIATALILILFTAFGFTSIWDALHR